VAVAEPSICVCGGYAVLSLYAGHFPGTKDYDYGRINKVPHPSIHTLPTKQTLAPQDKTEHSSSITPPCVPSPLLCVWLGGVQCGRRHGGLGLRGLVGQRLLTASTRHTMHTNHLRQYVVTPPHTKHST
jgi:hypothetical protein